MAKEEIILCDTDVIIEFYKNNSRIVSELASIGENNIAISTITAGELIYGALNKTELKQIKRDLEQLLVIDLDSDICHIFLDLMSQFSLSHKPGIPDTFIAATALSKKLNLFTLNSKDFHFIPNLKLHNYKY